MQQERAYKIKQKKPPIISFGRTTKWAYVEGLDKFYPCVIKRKAFQVSMKEPHGAVTAARRGVEIKSVLFWLVEMLHPPGMGAVPAVQDK
jgi:hypothetical protein